MGYSIWQSAETYWQLLRGQRLRFFFFSVLRSISELLYFVLVFAMGRIIDFFTNYSGGSLKDFYIYVGIIAASGSLAVWLRFFAKLRLYDIGARLRMQTRVDAMQRLADASLQWHEQEDTGSKIQRINTGSKMVYEAMYSFTNQGIHISTQVIGALILFAGLQWRYFAYALVYFVLYICGEWYFNRQLEEWMNKLNAIKEKVSGKLHESLSNIVTVKSLGANKNIAHYTDSYEQQYYAVWLQTKIVGQRKAKTVKIFSALAYAGFILLLGIDTVSGIVTVGFIIIYAEYFRQMFRASHEISNNMDTFIGIKNGLERFLPILQLEGENRKREVPKRWKIIEFRNVWFHYKENDVLQDFSLLIKRNSSLGIVGRSGCGKSTVIKLLLGLYTPTKGSICIDGIPVTEYSHHSLAQTIGVVLQDSEMFNMTLVENVTLGENINTKLLNRVLTIAQVQQVVKKMPDGIQTIIGEKGYKVSGGERQRIGIARALYRDTPALVLDEATSHLDTTTELEIQKGLESLEKKTMVLVAHRLSTLERVQKIIVLHNGKIVEEGSYSELLQLKGKFYSFHRLQKK